MILLVKTKDLCLYFSNLFLPSNCYIWYYCLKLEISCNLVIFFTFFKSFCMEIPDVHTAFEQYLLWILNNKLNCVTPVKLYWPLITSKKVQNCKHRQFKFVISTIFQKVWVFNYKKKSLSKLIWSKIKCLNLSPTRPMKFIVWNCLQ